MVYWIGVSMYSHLKRLMSHGSHYLPDKMDQLQMRLIGEYGIVTEVVNTL